MSYKNPLTGAYNIDGSRHTKEGYIPSLYLLMPEDACPQDPYQNYYAGWYFCDEVEQLNGPFNTMEEAAKALENYSP